MATPAKPTKDRTVDGKKTDPQRFVDWEPKTVTVIKK